MCLLPGSYQSPESIDAYERLVRELVDDGVIQRPPPGLFDDVAQDHEVR
jgi:hypothetical protein